MGKTCCVTGNRPNHFPWKYGEGREHEIYLADMARRVDTLIKDGYDLFLSGGALGVDQDFAEAVLAAKREHAEIRLEIAVPCKEQARSWSEAEKNRYQSILGQADAVNILSEHYTRFCMPKRNEYMVKKSDLVLAYWNGEKKGGTWYTISYAERQKKTVEICLLSEIHDLSCM